LEFYKLLNDGAGFETHLPIAVDGANNGTQILSILARDKELAIATNVANTDRPHDVYQKVIDAAMELILDKLDTISVSAQRLLSELKIDRSAAKKSTMCYPYSLSRHGAYGYIKACLKRQLKKLRVNTPIEREI
jgi:DNA-directed RNA polymerase